MTSVGPREPPSALRNIKRTRELLASQGYELRVFNNQSQDAYVELHASELLRSAYNAVLVGAARADIFRYLYLYREGGIWMDSKTYIGVELDKLVQRKEIVRIKQEASRWLGETIEQWFLAFPPRHPVLSATLDLATENICSGRFSDLAKVRATPVNSATKIAVLHMTGPIVYSEAWDLHPGIAVFDLPALFGRRYPSESIAYDATKGRYHAEKRGKHYSEARAIVDVERLRSTSASLRARKAWLS